MDFEKINEGLRIFLNKACFSLKKDDGKSALREIKKALALFNEGLGEHKNTPIGEFTEIRNLLELLAMTIFCNADLSCHEIFCVLDRMLLSCESLEKKVPCLFEGVIVSMDDHFLCAMDNPWQLAVAQ